MPLFLFLGVRAGYPHSLFLSRKKKRDKKELKQLLLSLTQFDEKLLIQNYELKFTSDYEFVNEINWYKFKLEMV